MARRHHHQSSRLHSHSSSDLSQNQQHPTATPSTTTLSRCTSHDDFTLASAGDPRSGSESKEEQAAAGSEASASLVAAGKGKRHAGLASLGPQPPLKKICHNTTVVRGAWSGQELDTMSSGAGTVDLSLPLTPPSPTQPLNPSLDSPPSPSHPQTPPHDFPQPSPPQVHQLGDHNLTLPTRPVNDLRLASPTSPSRSSHDISLTSPSLSSSSIGPSPAGTPTSSSSVSPVHGRFVGASGPAPSSGMESTEEGHGSAKTKRRKRNRKNKKLKMRQEREKLQEGLTADPGSHPSCPDSSVSEGGARGVAGLCQDSSESESFSGAASMGVKEEMNSESEGEQMSGLGDVAADFSGFDGATFRPGVNSFLRHNIESASGSFIRPSLVNGVHEEENDEDDSQVPIEITEEDLEGLDEEDAAAVRRNMERFGVQLGGARVGSEIDVGSSRGVVGELGVSASSSDGLSGGFSAERREEGERDEALGPDETKEEQVELEVREELAEQVEMALESKGEETEEVEGEREGKEDVNREGQEISEEGYVGEEGRKIDAEEREGESRIVGEPEGVMTDDPSTTAYDRSESGDYVKDDDDDVSRESGQIVDRHESREIGEEFEGEITCVSAAGGPESEQTQVIVINTNLEDINEFQSSKVVDHIEATGEGEEAIDIIEVTDVESKGDFLVVDEDKEEELKAELDEEEATEADLKIKEEELEEKEVVGEEKGDSYDNRQEQIKQKEAVERETDEEDINGEEGGKKEEEEDVAFPVTAPGPQTNGIVGLEEVVTADDVDIDVKLQVETTWRDESFTGEIKEGREALEGGNADTMVCEITAEDSPREIEKQPESWMKGEMERKEEVEEVESQVVKGEMEEEVERVVGEIVNRVEGEDKEGAREVEVETEESRVPGLEVGVSKDGFEAECGRDDLAGEIVDNRDGAEECHDEGVEVEEREVVGVEIENTEKGLEVEHRIDELEVGDRKSDVDTEEKKDDDVEVEVTKDGAEVGDIKDEDLEVEKREMIDVGPEDAKENVQEGESRDSFAVEDSEAGFEDVSGKDGIEVESREVPEVEENKTSVPEEVLMESAREDSTQQDTAPLGTTITNTMEEGQITGETAVISSPEENKGETPAAIPVTDTSSSTTSTTIPKDTATPSDAEAAAGDTGEMAKASLSAGVPVKAEV